MNFDGKRILEKRRTTVAQWVRGSNLRTMEEFEKALAEESWYATEAFRAEVAEVLAQYKAPAEPLEAPAAPENKTDGPEHPQTTEAPESDPDVAPTEAPMKKNRKKDLPKE
jgi:predicted nucleic acid-binding protein